MLLKAAQVEPHEAAHHVDANAGASMTRRLELQSQSELMIGAVPSLLEQFDLS